MSKKYKFLTILCALYLIFFVSYSFADSSCFLGGKWASNFTYYVSSSDQCYSNFVSAVNNLNSICNRKIARGTLLGSPVGVISADYGVVGWDGHYIVGGVVPYYTWGQIQLNLTYINNPNYTWSVTALATHEFSHILGLQDHYSNSPETIMMYTTNLRTATTPRSHDISDLATLYP